MVAILQGISDSSSKVAEIIAVIYSIAFQTNILALNAAVEAARAGIEGRRFAVAAAEVCTLAQRSATAAKEIQQLIALSTGRAFEGSALVESAGQIVSEIVGSVQRVTNTVGAIFVGINGAKSCNRTEKYSGYANGQNDVAKCGARRTGIGSRACASRSSELATRCG